jgi:hypothetical protein
MFHVIVAVLSILACIKWGDWKNWRLYYPTILFFFFVELLYNILTYNKPLWFYNSSGLNHTLTELLTSLVIFPCTVLIYLPLVSQKLSRQIFFTLLGIFIYCATEYLSYLLGYFSYLNGWNMFFSIAFNCIMFPILWIHHKRPLIGLSLTAAAAALVIWYFKIPITQLR